MNVGASIDLKGFLSETYMDVVRSEIYVGRSPSYSISTSVEGNASDLVVRSNAAGYAPQYALQQPAGTTESQ